MLCVAEKAFICGFVQVLPLPRSAKPTAGSNNPNAIKSSSAAAGNGW